MFYNNFKRICKEKGHTVSEVIRSIGMPRSTVTYWRQGKLPTLNTIYRLAEALGVKPSDLVPDSKETEETA